jgi:hypothetical protein
MLPLKPVYNGKSKARLRQYIKSPFTTAQQSPSSTAQQSLFTTAHLKPVNNGTEKPVYAPLRETLIASTVDLSKEDIGPWLITLFSRHSGHESG